jgi:hypothetical protein
MISTASSNVPEDDGSYYAAIPLEDEGFAASVETVEGMVRLVLVGPVVTATAVFSRAETRDVAYRMIEASQRLWEEEG